MNWLLLLFNQPEAKKVEGKIVELRIFYFKYMREGQVDETVSIMVFAQTAREAYQILFNKHYSIISADGKNGWFLPDDNISIPVYDGLVITEKK